MVGCSSTCKESFSVGPDGQMLERGRWRMIKNSQFFFDTVQVVQPRNEAASPETRYKGWKMKKIYHLSSIVPSTGSLPLRLAHGRADAGVQAGHGHHALRVHQGLHHRRQAGSLVTLDVRPWELWLGLKSIVLASRTFTEAPTHYWARRSTEKPEIKNGQFWMFP